MAKDGDSEGVFVIADTSIENGGDFVVGANEVEYHYTGTNYPRDFAVTQMADIAEAGSGHVCGNCGEGTLSSRKAIEAGHCFKLGLRYSKPTNTTALGSDGKPHLVYMGSYGIGLDRLMAIIVEKYHDDSGIVWPRSVAPYDVHLMNLGKEEEPKALCDQLYKDLKAAGFSVIYDDRPKVNPGVKFKDADLMGMPIRIAIGRRSIENGGAEVKLRTSDDREVVAIDDLIAHVKAM